MKRFLTLLAASVLLAGCSPVIHIAADPLTLNLNAEPLTLKVDLPESLGKAASPTPASAPDEKAAVEPPAGGGSAEAAGPGKPEPVAAAPAKEKPARHSVAKPEAKGEKPSGPGADLAGFWSSVSASGPGSETVRSVEMIFGDAGDWSANLFFEPDGHGRFQSLQGRWSLAGDRLTVTLSDGRQRPWTATREGDSLVLRDGEAELKLERVKE